MVVWHPHYRVVRYGKEEHQATVATTARGAYVGNLSFVTTDRQLYELFSRAGPVEQVIMGLNRVTKQPCGFCFVMYVRRRPPPPHPWHRRCK